MDTETIIWIVVAVVVALVVLALLGWAFGKKRKLDHRERASELRSDVQARSGGIVESDRDARAAQADAERARLEAERADARAREARVARDQERAELEDRVREADRVDPDVDHKADDYRPDVPGDETGHGTTGRHADTSRRDVPPA